MNTKRFTLIVDFDKRRWRMFPFKGKYGGIDPHLKLEHFPVRYSGKAEVTVELVQHEVGTTFKEHLTICERQGAHEIDRAITEVFLRKFPDEHKESWILSPCGSELKCGTYQGVAYVAAEQGIISLRVCWSCDRWEQSGKYLVVRKIKPLAA